MNKEESTKREFYIYTMILTPSILIGIVGIYLTSWSVRLITQAILLFLQGVLLKGIMENK